MADEISNVTTVPCGEVDGAQLKIEAYATGDVYIWLGEKRFTLNNWHRLGDSIIKGMIRLEQFALRKR